MNEGEKKLIRIAKDFRECYEKGVKDGSLAMEEEYKQKINEVIDRIKEANKDKNSHKAICLGCTYGLLKRFEKELGLETK